MSQTSITEREILEVETSEETPAENWFEKIQTNVDKYLTEIRLKEQLMSLGISEDNVSLVTIGIAGILILLGIILIIVGSRRR